jgi:hypothetical protein
VSSPVDMWEDGLPHTPSGPILRRTFGPETTGLRILSRAEERRRRRLRTRYAIATDLDRRIARLGYRPATSRDRGSVADSGTRGRGTMVATTELSGDSKSSRSPISAALSSSASPAYRSSA